MTDVRRGVSGEDADHPASVQAALGCVTSAITDAEERLHDDRRHCGAARALVHPR
ncbi:hypothetical protein ACFPRL_19540 [Pseudoclavibacter helvolus]